MAQVSLPEQFNLANYYLYDRLGEGLADKVALRYGDLSYTYGDVAERTKSLHSYFNETGVCPEQRILICIPDTPAFAWSFFATLAHGAVVAMGNPHAPAEDLAYLLDYSRAAILITTPRVAADTRTQIAAASWLKALLIVPDVATGENPEAHDPIVDELEGRVDAQVKSLHQAVQHGRELNHNIEPNTKRDDVAIWLFTSGSTGRSKAAVHMHGDFAFNTEHFAKETLGYRQDDVTISVPRLFFGYATGTNLMFPFAVGATACLFSERPTPESLSNAIGMYQPTIVTNVPTMMAKCLDYDDHLAKQGQPVTNWQSVRFCMSAGEALPPALLDRFMKRYSCDVYDGIGSAEMFHIYVSNQPGDIKPGSLGKVVSGYEIRVLPTDCYDVGTAEVPVGEVGCLWVKGDSVATHYYQDRQKSWQTFHGHWCRTGDLFRKDTDGYLWFGGRADSLFKVGGIFVAPLEIEECLMEHEAVAMSAVIPAKRDDLEKPKAFIVLRDHQRSACKTSEAIESLRKALQDHVMAKLSKHKYPRWVVFVDDLPKNDRGKVNRKVLIEQEARGVNPWE